MPYTVRDATRFASCLWSGRPRLATRASLSAVTRIIALWTRNRDAIINKPFRADFDLEVDAQYRILLRSWATSRALQPKPIKAGRLDLAKTRAVRYLNRLIRKAVSESRCDLSPIAFSQAARASALRHVLEQINQDGSLYLLELIDTHTRRERGPCKPVRHRRWKLGLQGFDPIWHERPAPGERASFLERSRITAPPEIPPSSVEGRCGFIHGDRPQTILDGTKTPMMRFLGAHSLHEDGANTGLVPLCAGGSFETSAHHLKAFYEEDAGVGDYTSLLSMLPLSLHELGLCRLGPVGPDTFWNTGCNPKAYPGPMSFHLGKTKGRVYDVSVWTAEAVWAGLEFKQLLDCSPWVCGGREKRQWRDFQDDDIKSRMIQMCEGGTSQFALAFAVPLVQMFRDARSSIKIGMSFAKGKWRDFVNDYDSFHVKAFDWSSYDSRVGEKLMVTSMGLLRSCFPPGTRIDRAFVFILSSLVNKHVVTPTGHVSRVSHGIPSGHPFTSLIGSVANWLIHRDVLKQICTDEVNYGAKVAVCGDDTFVSFQGGAPETWPSTEVYLKVANDRWRAVGKLDSASEGPLCPILPEAAPPFLSYRFPFGFPAKSRGDIILLEAGAKHPPKSWAEHYHDYYWITTEPTFNWQLSKMDEETLVFFAQKARQNGQGGEVPETEEQVRGVAEWIRSVSVRTFVGEDTGVGVWGAQGGDNRRKVGSFPPQYACQNPQRGVKLVRKIAAMGKGSLLNSLWKSVSYAPSFDENVSPTIGEIRKAFWDTDPSSLPLVPQFFPSSRRLDRHTYLGWDVGESEHSEL